MARGDPKLTLYGPDEKHGAVKKASFKTYRYYVRHKGRDYATGYGLSQKREADDFLANYIKGQHVKSDPRTVAHALKLYVDSVLNKRTRQVTVSTAANVLEAIGDRRIDEVSSAVAVSYIATRRGAGAKDSTIRNEIRVLNSALRRVLGNKHESLPMPRKPGTAGRAATRDEIAGLLRACKKADTHASDDLALFILVSLYCCQRYDSVVKLAWTPHKDGGFVDVDRNLIDFNKHGAAITNKARGVMPIPPNLRAILRARKRRGGIYVFPGKSGGARSCNNGSWRLVRARAGLPWMRRHDLVHTGASWRARVTPIDVLGKLINKTTKTLLQYYVHHFDDQILAAANTRLR